MTDGKTYVLSAYVQALRLDDDTVAITHGPRLQRMVVADAIYEALTLFEDNPLSFDDFAGAIELPDVAAPRETMAALFAAFREKGFLVAAGSDEEAELRPLVRARVVDGAPTARYQMPHRMTLDRFEVPPAAAKSLRHVEVLLLGGCLVELTEEPLRALAASYGLTIGVRSGWLGDTHLAGEAPTDLVVVQPGVHRLLAPLWGGMSLFDSDGERRRVLDQIKRELERSVRGLDHFAGYVLLQGIAGLQAAPHGRADARLSTGHHRIVAELNDTLRALAADRPNRLFVDEERLTANHGRAALLDDMVTLSAHHGPLDPTLPRLLAREYLDCYVVLSGLRRIKCIVTDLDNTLWAGVVGEGDAAPNALAHPFPGIHEALRMCKERGVVLATCSKNNHDDVMRFWARVAEEPGCLRPDDFVLHSINWDPKSRNVGVILDKLGVAADAALLIDDHPVERAEVQARFPELRLLGEEMGRVRAALLDDPCLQPNLVSDEARSRTMTTRAKLSREEARAQSGDDGAFLRSLGVRLNVARVRTPLHHDRIVELSQRTNQFNTTLVRYDLGALQRLAADERAAVWVMAAKDRFAPYGLVGICVVDGERIDSFAISCRTIGLKLDQPFLATVLAESRLWDKRVVGRIVEGERNHPCRRLFTDAQFSAIGDGLYTREPTAAAPTVDRSVYHVHVCDEAELVRFD